MHSQPPVASQHKKTNKVIWTYEDDRPPKRTSTYKRPFTQEGNYLVMYLSSNFMWKRYNTPQYRSGIEVTSKGVTSS